MVIELAKKAHSFQAVAYVLTGPQSNSNNVVRTRVDNRSSKGPRGPASTGQCGNHNERVQPRFTSCNCGCHSCRYLDRSKPRACAIGGGHSYSKLLSAVNADDPA